MMVNTFSDGKEIFSECRWKGSHDTQKQTCLCFKVAVLNNLINTGSVF